MLNAKDDLIVIIPAYEPPKEFIEYAERVAGMAKGLVVVNDGSGDAYDDVFSQISGIENVTYLTYEGNHGKGYALRYAIQYCIDHFRDGDTVVTADCDGQHSIEDVLKVYLQAAQHRRALILGSRDFHLSNVPGRSRAGNAHMRRIFHLLYGLNVYDTQTGLRGFSLSLAREYLQVKGDRFEYEMGVLIYSQKNGIPISEIPIATIYPDDPKDHVSHFKTISDSVRMLGTVLKNLNWYILSSALSGLLDITVFFVLSTLVFGEVSALNTLIATVSARLASSILNCLINYRYVFAGKSKRSFYRYYILWFFQLGASYGLVFLFGNVLGWNLVIMKVIGDLCLAFFSYQIQRLWVFKDGASGEFYGPLVSIARQIACAFSKSYRCNAVPYEEGVVYVCRHLNMHGPYTTLKWLKFHVHPMMLHPFFNAKECYRQFADYTFTERYGKKKRRFHFNAFICSRFVPLAVRSIKAIPVYRNSAGVVRTFKDSISYLKKGESVIVYPDVDYTGESDAVSEIYDGFLYLGELYKRRTGKSLRFVPLYIDEKRRTVNEFDPITVDNFKKEKDAAAEYLKLAINGKENFTQIILTSECK